MPLDDLWRVCSPAQIRSIHEAQTTPQIALWAGAVSSGKTIASLVAFFIALTRAPDRGLVVIVGRTLQTIERNILDPLQAADLFGILAGQVHHTPGSTTATILGRTVHLIGASDVRAEARIRGATIALAYVDEATLVPHSFWMMLLSRLRVPGARLLATTNPDGPQHWLKREFIDRADTVGLRYWHFTLDDNPSLDADYVARLKRQYTGLWHRRFILGEWCLAAGAVYEMWDEQRHLVDELPPITRWLACGLDYGTTNPFHALVVGVGTDGRLYVTAEWRWDSSREHRQLTDVEYSQRLREWLATQRGVDPEYVIVDPSAASFRVQLYRDGVRAVLGDNSVLDGIRTVSSLLAVDALRVHASCVELAREMAGYSWDEQASERGEDAPLKVDDHGPDALRYAVHTTRALWRPLLRDQITLAA